MKTKYWIYGGLALGAVGVIVLIVKSRQKLTRETSLNTLVGNKLSKAYASANAKHLASLNAAERQNFLNFFNDIQRMGYTVVITSSYRSTADQIKQKNANSKNATPCFSSHEYGIALDLNLVKDGKWINKNSPLDVWRKTGVVDLAKNKYGMRWGGDFPGYPDSVHFDEAKKHDINKLCTLAVKQFGTKERIQGNKMTLTV
jgi:hypothetical protein